MKKARIPGFLSGLGHKLPGRLAPLLRIALVLFLAAALLGQSSLAGAAAVPAAGERVPAIAEVTP